MATLQKKDYPKLLAIMTYGAKVNVSKFINSTGVEENPQNLVNFQLMCKKYLKTYKKFSDDYIYSLFNEHEDIPKIIGKLKKFFQSFYNDLAKHASNFSDSDTKAAIKLGARKILPKVTEDWLEVMAIIKENKERKDALISGKYKGDYAAYNSRHFE